MPRLISCGASIADRYGTGITHAYGDYLAKVLDYDYIHNARFQASNDRSYKLVVTQVGKGIIKAGDVVVFQISESVRQDLPGVEQRVNINTDPDRPGLLSRYNSHLWSMNGKESRNNIRLPDNNLSCDKMMEFYDISETAFALNPKFYTEQWLTQGLMFQGFLKAHGIKFLPIIHRCIGELRPIINKFLTAENFQNAFWEAHIWHREEHGVDPNSGIPDREFVLGDPDNTGYFDEHHYNETGHRYVAEKLYTHGKECGLF